MEGNPSSETRQIMVTDAAGSAVKSAGRCVLLAFVVALAACSSPADAPLPLDVDILISDAVASIEGGDAQVLVSMTVTNRESGRISVSNAYCGLFDALDEYGRLLFSYNRMPPATICDTFGTADVASGESRELTTPIRVPIATWGSSVEGRYRLRLLVPAEERQSAVLVTSKAFTVATK